MSFRRLCHFYFCFCCGQKNLYKYSHLISKAWRCSYLPVLEANNKSQGFTLCTIHLHSRINSRFLRQFCRVKSIKILLDTAFRKSASISKNLERFYFNKGANKFQTLALKNLIMLTQKCIGMLKIDR